MKKIFAFLIVILATVNLYSQGIRTSVYDAPVVGVKLGLNHSTFRYSDPNLKSLPHELFIRPNVGVASQPKLLSGSGIVSLQQRTSNQIYLRNRL